MNFLKWYLCLCSVMFSGLKLFYWRMSGQLNKWRMPLISWSKGKTRCQDRMQFWRMPIRLCVSFLQKEIFWVKSVRIAHYLNLSVDISTADMVKRLIISVSERNRFGMWDVTQNIRSAHVPSNKSKVCMVHCVSFSYLFLRILCCKFIIQNHERFQNFDDHVTPIRSCHIVFLLCYCHSLVNVLPN
jgi:hypothetical protein